MGKGGMQPATPKDIEVSKGIPTNPTDTEAPWETHPIPGNGLSLCSAHCPAHISHPR